MRYRDECMPLVSYVDTVYQVLLTTTFARRSLTTGTIFALIFMLKSYFLFFGTPSPSILQVRQKRVCIRASVSVCALTRTYITCASTNYVDVPELPPSRPGTQPLVIMLLCGFFWRSNRNHYLLVLVMRACACHVYPCTYLPTEIQ